MKLKSPTKSTTPGVSPYKKDDKQPDEVKEISKCIRCDAPLKPSAKFCIQCGGKVEGRKTESSSVITPATAKNCALCGSKLSSSENFCKWCGTKIENKL